jgi:hypothetical protein
MTINDQIELARKQVEKIDAQKEKPKGVIINLDVLRELLAHYYSRSME